MVWGHDYFGEVKIVDVNIRRLRLKIEDNPQNPTYITTVWGYGYKWGFLSAGDRNAVQFADADRGNKEGGAGI